MNQLVVRIWRLSALFLLLMSMPHIGWAQPFFAEPDGTGVGCEDPTNACDLPDAVAAANASAGTDTIFLRINNNGAPSVFDLDGIFGILLGILDDVTFDIYIDDGTPTPPTGQTGTAIIEGDVAIDGDVTVSLVANITVELIGQPGTLFLEDGATFDGDGWLAFTNTNGTYTIFLGSPVLSCIDAPAANAAFFENMLVDMPGGTVEVIDECAVDNNFSIITINNNLTVDHGTLDMDDNSLTIVAEDDDTGSVPPRVTLENPSAVIQGVGIFFISVESASSGGNGFANTRTDCFLIDGDGVLDIAFDKNTDAGVCMDLPAIGTGGNSTNNAGALFVREATQVIGSFENEGSARTEFDKLTTITNDLTVVGPGNEVDNLGSAFINGSCDGNESGVYFFAAVTIGDDFALDDTDDPSTIDCTEGANFEAALLVTTDASVVQGDFFADDNTGVYLDSDSNVFHNVEFQGDVFFDEAPTFELDQPAVAFVLSTLCETYAVESPGNKVIFGGDEPQIISYTDPNGAFIPSVAIHKTAVGVRVEIDENVGGVLTIGTTLELINGTFETNGLLDANSTTDPATGATITLNRTSSEVGILDASEDSAYAVANTLNSGPENQPRKVAYYGNQPRFTADEIPGNANGSLANDEVVLEEIEIYVDPTADPVPIITLSKDFTITSRLRVTQGNLQVGSSDLTLANEVQIAIGNGSIIMPQAGGGNMIFPTIAANETNNNGIDLSYFGTNSPHPVSKEWPTDQPNLIRNVEIDRECGSEQLEVTLRDDETFRMNPDDASDDAATLNREAGLWIYDGSTLDLNGATLEVNAANGNDNEISVATEGRLRDSEADDLDGISTSTPARTAFAEELAAFKHAMRTAEEASLRPSMELYQALETLRAEQQAASKAQDHIGLLKYIGSDETDTFIETTASQLEFFFPAIEIDKGADGHVTFDASGIASTASEDRLDVLSTYAFTLTSAALGNDGDDNTTPDAGGVEMLDGLDVLDVRHDYTQHDGEFQMSGFSSPGPFGPVFQLLQTGRLGGDFIENDGEFFTEGGDVTAFGRFYLGQNLGVDPGDALFSLSFSGIHTVVGDFVVGSDTDPCSGETAAMAGDACAGMVTPRDDARRNRYFQSGVPGEVNDLGGTILFSDFSFLGTGDRFLDGAFTKIEQGLQGNTIFVGATPQTIIQRQDEDAFLSDVVMSSTGLDAGIRLQQDTYQNDTGTLTLEFGIIDAGTDNWDWVNLNPDPETDLVGRNNALPGEGTMLLGFFESYINGPVQRPVQFSNRSGGIITGGTLFPVGVPDAFRPLILQFNGGLIQPRTARVQYRQDLSSADVTFTSLIVPDAGGTNLTLDTVGPQFWQLEFDQLPSENPNVRLELEGMGGINQIRKLRIIQWNCDGTNPRLAGIFNVDGDPPNSAVVTDFISGIPNITQEGVDVVGCNLFGIATNGSINPIAENIVSISGTIELVNDTPVPGVLVDFSDPNVADDQTGASGVFVINAATGGTETITPQNDGSIPGSNSRGVNVGDILFTRQHILGNDPFADPYTIIAADATHDNAVNVGDILAIRQLILNEVVPNGGLWRFLSSDFSFSDPMDPFVDVPFPESRTYDPLTGPQPDQDFVAIKKGDVDHSWTAPASSLAEKQGEQLASAGVVRLNVQQQQDAETVLVAVRASSFEDVAAYQMTLSWDTSVLEYAGFVEGGLPGLGASNFGTYRVEDGLLTTLWDDARGKGQTLAENTSLFVLRFRVVGGGDRSVSIGSSAIPARAYRGSDMALLSVEAEGESVSTDMETGEVPLQYTLEANYPNPFNPETRIGYVLRESVAVRLAVYDVLGREVRVLVDGHQEAGRHEATFDGSGLPSGVYYYRLEAGDFRAAQQMLLLK